MYRALHRSSPIHETAILSNSLITIVVSYGFIFLHTKSKVFYAFKRYFSLIENRFSKNIKILCADYEGQYMSQEFQQFLQSKGMISYVPTNLQNVDIFNSVQLLR